MKWSWSLEGAGDVGKRQKILTTGDSLGVVALVLYENSLSESPKMSLDSVRGKLRYDRESSSSSSVALTNVANIRVASHVLYRDMESPSWS